MAANNNSPNGSSRSVLAYGILIFSGLAIAGSAVMAIIVDRGNAITIVNIVLPVITSWVGTILAFYFGRENFEAANQQVLQLVRRLTPEERSTASVTSIMRRLTDLVYIFVTRGGSENEPLTGWISNVRMAKFLEVS